MHLNRDHLVLIYSIQDSFYKTLTAEQHQKAHANEYDFDCPESIDFDVLVDTLRDLKKG
jgi:uridine kinase